MSQDFRRKIEVIIGTRKWTYPELEITFNIRFDSDSIPDEGTISIFNLSDDSINAITTGQNIIVNAGYGDDIGTILDGVIKDAELLKNGTDRELKITALNVTSQYLDTQIAYTYGSDVDSEYLIRDVLKYAGITPNVVNLTNPQVYDSFAAYGKVIDIVKQLAGDAGSDIVIRNSSISVVPSSSSGGDDIGFLLNSKTGLLDIQGINKSNTPAKYKIKMNLRHPVNAYTILEIGSNTYNGMAVVSEGEHSSTDFTTTVEMIPL